MLPCSVQLEPTCKDCAAYKKLLCRCDPADTLHFLILALPYFVTTIAGVIVAGFGWFLLGWLTYAIFFFFRWEARVLCSHCPYWAEPSRVLHCHANYGVTKIWKYHPEPMNRSEKAQFALGALAFIIYPIALLLLGKQFLLASIAIVSSVSWGYLLYRNICSHCINFSCPMNGVPKSLVSLYLQRNPTVREAWEKAGFPVE
ncbi:MAG: hypothetical protein JW908_09925 [Anaerolineales bacterium]|nr:hypothetical protein [Anaerolineales bacterium]